LGDPCGESAGDVYELYIPSDLAYGDSGSPPKIPGGAALVFKLAMIEILEADKDKLPLAIRCDATTGENCNDKEKAYIEKTSAWTDEKKTTELKRLGNLIQEKEHMKPELVNWILRRTKILEKTLESGDAATGKKEEEL